MEPLSPPATHKVYTVIKQTGMSMSYVYVSMASSVNYGAGFTAPDTKPSRLVHLNYSKKPLYLNPSFTCLNLKYLTQHIKNDIQSY